MTPQVTHTRIRPFNTKDTYPEQNLDNDLCQAVVVLLVCVGATAATTGLIGWVLAVTGAVWLVGDMAERVPPERHTAFLADGSSVVVRKGVKLARALPARASEAPRVEA